MFFMGKVMTVTGEVKSSELGLTSMHEHLLCDTSSTLGPVLTFYGSKIPEAAKALNMPNLANLRAGTSVFSKECCTLDALEYTVAELNYFKAMGGGCIVDASPLGMPHNLMGLRDASRQSGVKIVVCTGLYIRDAQPEAFRRMSQDALVEKFKKDIYEGIDGTDIKAGFLKCAVNTLNDAGQVDEYEMKAVRACARAAAETGLSLHIHNAYPLTRDHIVPVARMVLDMGVTPDKLVMLHMGAMVRDPRTTQEYVNSFETRKGVNIDLMVELLELGCNIGFDCYGNLVPILPDNDDMNKALVELLRRGYGDHIVLGHDITDKTRGVSYGYTGFTDFIRSVPPALKGNGMEDMFTKLTVVNPARIMGI